MHTLESGILAEIEGSGVRIVQRTHPPPLGPRKSRNPGQGRGLQTIEVIEAYKLDASGDSCRA